MPSITVLGPEGTQNMLNQMLITWNNSMGNYFNLETLSETDLEQRVEEGDFQAAVCALRSSSSTPCEPFVPLCLHQRRESRPLAVPELRPAFGASSFRRGQRPVCFAAGGDLFE